MADISTTNKKARIPVLGENGRFSDAYLPQAVIDAEASSKTYAENAKSYSELVKKDAESAASSAASAKKSADAAREGISSIDEKVTQAGQFAEAASSSATEANNYLEQVTAVSGTVSGIASSVVENAQVAETFANKSKESAASALTASTNAVNAKIDAEGYRDSAKSYSDNAKADADTAKNILESVKAQKAEVDSTVQQFNADATEYDTKFNGYVSEAKESKEASAASATSASESAENASTSATNASTSADKAKTSADAAALSATNAANSAKEAADNLSLLGASTLTRKEKDTFIHVDDAFPAKLLGIEIEGACRQDGTPSPDNPVPIEVIENPVLRVTGKNLLKYPFAFSHANQETISGITFTDNGDGSISIEGTSTSSTFYNLDFSSNAKQLIGKTICIQDIASKDIKFSVGFFFEDGSYSDVLSTRNNILKAKVPEKVTTQRIYIGLSANVTVNDTIRPFIYFEDDDGEFAEYTSQEQAFTLPAEHPYLAKLPDGTADEIRVDREGNVSLVANVQKLDLSNLSAPNEVVMLKNGLSRYSYWYALDKPAKKDSPCITPNFESVIDFYFTKQGCYASEKVLIVGAAADQTDTLKTYGHAYSILKIPENYSLGKIEMLNTQDSIMNMWTDAEVTPMTGAEYVRDANIVVSNLEEAIASITQG